jgi:hypothetical protein
MPGPANIAFGNIANNFVVLVPVAAGATIGAATSVARTYTVIGLRVGDIITANKPSAFTAGLGLVNARVSAADTLELTFMNATAGALSIQTESWLIQVDRSAYDNPLVQIPTAIG